MLYVHCTNGNGRTGTVCSLLLGALYGVSGPAALFYFQALHDMRQKVAERSVAETYDVRADASGCVALYAVQREQVLRLLGPEKVGDAKDPTELMLTPVAVSSALVQLEGGLDLLSKDPDIARVRLQLLELLFASCSKVKVSPMHGGLPAPSCLRRRALATMDARMIPL